MSEGRCMDRHTFDRQPMCCRRGRENRTKTTTFPLWIKLLMKPFVCAPETGAFKRILTIINNHLTNISSPWKRFEAINCKRYRHCPSTHAIHLSHVNIKYSTGRMESIVVSGVMVQRCPEDTPSPCCIAAEFSPEREQHHRRSRIWSILPSQYPFWEKVLSRRESVSRNYSAIVDSNNATRRAKQGRYIVHFYGFPKTCTTKWSCTHLLSHELLLGKMAPA